MRNNRSSSSPTTAAAGFGGAVGKTAFTSARASSYFARLERELCECNGIPADRTGIYIETMRINSITYRVFRRVVVRRSPRKFGVIQQLCFHSQFVQDLNIIHTRLHDYGYRQHLLSGWTRECWGGEVVVRWSVLGGRATMRYSLF